MMADSAKPLIVQSDRTILLEADNALYEEARDAVAGFSEIVKSPEHYHTYRITGLSLWNAAAGGMTAESILEGLRKYSKYEVPSSVEADVVDYVSRYGRLKLTEKDDRLILSSDDNVLIAMVWQAYSFKQR